MPVMIEPNMLFWCGVCTIKVTRSNQSLGGFLFTSINDYLENEFKQSNTTKSLHDIVYSDIKPLFLHSCSHPYTLRNLDRLTKIRKRD